MILVSTLIISGCQGPTAEPRPAPSRIEDPAPSAFDFQLLSPDLKATPSWGTAWSDVDHDGFPDLFLVRHKRHAWFLANEDGELVKQKAPALLEPAPGKSYFDRHNCAWGEADGDGDPDVFCVAGAESGSGTGPNQLLLGSGTELTEATPRVLVDRFSRGRSVNWLDFDLDGDLDIFVGNEYREGYPNSMFVRTKHGFRRREVGVETTMATISSSWADWDSDGDPDLIALGHGSGASHVYENESGSFTEVIKRPITGREWLSADWADFDHDLDLDLLLTGIDSMVVAANRSGRFRIVERFDLQAGRHGVWLDIENDGYADIFVVQGRPGAPPLDDPPVQKAKDSPDLSVANDSGRFSVAERFRWSGSPQGNGGSVAVSDFDRDGRLDLLVTSGYLDVFGPVLLGRNTAPSENWAAVELVGTRRNPFAFGSSIRVLGPSSWLIPVTDGVAFRSQSEAGHIVIGLGERNEVDIEVVWPDGAVTCTSLRHGETSRLHQRDADRC